MTCDERQGGVAEDDYSVCQVNTIPIMGQMCPHVPIMGFPIMAERSTPIEVTRSIYFLYYLLLVMFKPDY